MQKLLLVCPLDSEVRPLLEGFTELGLDVEKRAGLKTPAFWIPQKGFVISRGGHGKSQFAIQTQYLLSHLKDMEAVICAGAAGGLGPHLEVGDLVVGEKTIEHDYTERFSPNAKLPEFAGHSSLIGRFKNLSLHDSFKIHFGSIAGGDEDIVDAMRAQELYQSTRSLAVAWEGPGGARAAKFNDLPYLEIRAITDNARDSVPNSFSQNLGRCMKNLATALHHAF